MSTIIITVAVALINIAVIVAFWSYTILLQRIIRKLINGTGGWDSGTRTHLMHWLNPDELAIVTQIYHWSHNKRTCEWCRQEATEIRRTN